MAYTETTRTSYGKRLGNSLSGILVGLVMIIGGTVLLWWNEGRAVHRTKLLKEAQGQVVEMPDITTVNPEFQGKLVHASGLPATTDILSDSRFKVSVKGATALKREVEYYQWVESSETTTKDKIGGAQETTTTYYYNREWVSSPIDSRDFHDPEYKGKNSVKEQLESYTHYAKDVSFGAFKLTDGQIASISGFVPIQATDSTATSFYIGKDASNPEIGDVRIKFYQVLPSTVSIISCVNGDSFTPFVSKSGKTFDTLVMGTVSQEQIFEGEHATNKMVLWLLRILGFFLIYMGLRNVFNILETLLKVLPFLSNILGWGLGIVCFVIALVWTLVVAAIAWVAYRPVLAIGLLLIAAAAIWYFCTHKKKKVDLPGQAA